MAASEQPPPYSDDENKSPDSPPFLEPYKFNQYPPYTNIQTNIEMGYPVQPYSTQPVIVPPAQTPDTDEAKTVIRVSAVMGIAALALLSVGIATPYWFLSTIDKKMYAGFFKICAMKSSYGTAGGIDDGSTYWSAPRSTESPSTLVCKYYYLPSSITYAWLIGNVVCFGIGVLLNIAVVFSPLLSKRRLAISSVCFYVSAVIWLAIMLFRLGSYKENSSLAAAGGLYFGWSLYITIPAPVIGFIVVMMLFIAINTYKPAVGIAGRMRNQFSYAQFA